MAYVTLLIFFVSVVRDVCNLSAMANYNNLESENFDFMDFPLKPYKLFSIDNRPQCAKNNTFCEKMPNYPYQLVDNILQNSNIQFEIFKLVDSFFELRKMESEDDYICKSIREVIRPEVALNFKGQWRYIINQKGNSGLVQELEIETCRPSRNPCGLHPPPGYTTGCTQKYLYRRLLSFSEDGKPIVDIFSFPSACGCSYKTSREMIRNLFRRPHF